MIGIDIEIPPSCRKCPCSEGGGTILANGLFDARCEIEKCHFQTKMDIRPTECPLIDLSKSKWIPCSERMPDTDYDLWSEPVLVTRKGKHPNGEEWYVVEKASYCGELLSSDGKYRDTPGWAIGTNTYSTDYIIAWMPLPEPYKAEEES